MDRRALLKRTAAAAAAAPLAVGASAAAREKRTRAGRGGSSDGFAGKNVLVYLIDQQRATQHFPPGWEETYLPSLTRLKRTGLSFERAFCNSSMCSPSRATLFTGLFPAQHGVKYTLEADMPAPQYPQVEMPVGLPNLATTMAAAGYSVPYKGKWHCSKAAAGITDPAQDPPCEPNEGWVPADLEKYGFVRWNPQDAGANQDICQAGGGSVDNDRRFIEDDGPVEEGKEGVLAFLRSDAAKAGPFFLTVGMVNPHDVLFYPGEAERAGYDESWFASTGIDLPTTVSEDLSTKPEAQQQFRDNIFAGGLPPETPEQQRLYLNFYGNLMRSTDAYLGDILAELEAQGLLEDTIVVVTADHGEVGTAHGGLIQKNFNFYEETIRVPMVYSNPVLWPEPETSDALVSHVDFLPTMASLFGAPASPDWQGKNYAKVLRDSSAKGPQDYVVFTFDDWQGGQANPPYVRGANHIASIRERRWKLARYYSPSGISAPEYEMYDLENDPLERRNLAWPGYTRTKEQEKAYQRLLKRLDKVEKTRLQPLA